MGTRSGQKSKYQYAGEMKFKNMLGIQKNAVGRSHVVGKKQPNN